MSILYVGIDLAKNVFAVHGVNEAGKADLLKPAIPRARRHEVIAVVPSCTIGMEACSGAHHWARLFQSHGHTVKLMAPKFVAPYRLSGRKGKNDAADAAAVCAPRRAAVSTIDSRGAIWRHWPSALHESLGRRKGSAGTPTRTFSRDGHVVDDQFHGRVAPRLARVDAVANADELTAEALLEALGAFCPGL